VTKRVEDSQKSNKTEFKKIVFSMTKNYSKSTGGNKISQSKLFSGGRPPKKILES
jgi:hypothetical protein